MSDKPLKLTEIAARIHTHLKRMEADPEINAPRPRCAMTRPFYFASSRRAGARVNVKAINYQTPSSLTREEALAFLAWLDDGNNGTIHDFNRQRREAKA